MCCWQYFGTFGDYLQEVAWHQHLPSPQALRTYCVCVCVHTCIHTYTYTSTRVGRLGTKFKCCCVIAEFSNQES